MVDLQRERSRAMSFFKIVLHVPRFVLENAFSAEFIGLDKYVLHKCYVSCLTSGDYTTRTVVEQVSTFNH